MTRLAGLATLYALIAALVLVTPLSASQEPAPDTVPAGTAAPAATTTPEAAAQEAAPPAVPGSPPPDSNAAPQSAAPPPVSHTPAELTPAGPASGQPAPAAPAPAAGAAPETPTASAGGADDGAAPASAELDRRRSGRAPIATAAADTSVTISDFQFAPASVTIDVGDTVTWNNDGPTAHSATADDGEFDTGIFDAGQSRSHTFDQAGTFTYFCTPHPNMQGTVTVRAASGDADDTAGDAGDTGGGSGTDDSGAAGSDTSGDSSDAALPATGRDTGGLAVLGLMTLALGVWLRRRSAAAERGRALGGDH
jgi:LPXTG-motif cell wall-anchored protein